MSRILGAYPPSRMQEDTLIAAVAQPESRAYFAQVRFEVFGDIDEQIAREGWKALFARHEALRTVLRHGGVEPPLHVVFAEREPEVRFADLRAMDVVTRAREIEGFCKEERVHGFDLQRDVPVRVAFLRTDTRTWQLVLSYHHLLLDGWSLAILQREFATIYASLVEGRAPSLGPARPYRDYLAWSQAHAADPGREHWTGVLHGYEQVATLPHRAGAASAESRRYALRFDRDTTQALGTLAARSRATLDSLLPTLWALVLMRYNDTDDVVFGTVDSGRSAEFAGADTIVGPFLNTIPLRVRIDPGDTFSTALRGVQAQSPGSMPLREPGFAEIPAASPLGQGLFDHVLVFEHALTADCGAGEALAFRRIGAHDRGHYDFVLVVAPGRELVISFLYDAGAIDDALIARVAAYFGHVARFLVSEPAARIDAIPPLAPAEAASIAAWGGTPAAAGTTTTIVDLLEAQAERTPDARALGCDTASLTYRELNERANFLAALLRAEFAVGPEERVGLLLDRSEHMVIALLAVLKAGGAYVPIDPGLPPRRTAYVLDDADARLVITQAKYRAQVPPNRVMLELPLTGTRAENLPRIASAKNLSYVLYTSGTTGAPKGCEIEHASLLFYLEWAKSQYFDERARGNFGLFSPLSFDLTVTSLFLPLMRGRTLTVFAQDADPADVLAAIFGGRHAIDAVKLTPSHIALLECLGLTTTSVSLAIVGGEAFTPRQAQVLWKLNPAMRIVNEYGPTEATVGCIVHDLRPGEAVIPIGRPITGSCAALLDRRRAPVPIGAMGELYVGGPGVARGYRNRPELQAERFLDDGNGTRLYRTGDFARYLPEGVIEYLGRQDHQIKIRGFRVELGDVESALERLSGVTRAVVVAEHETLTAYIESPELRDARAAREHARASLPEYMVPARYVFVDAMPLTPNGKIDKARLAASSSGREAGLGR